MDSFDFMQVEDYMILEGIDEDLLKEIYTEGD